MKIAAKVQYLGLNYYGFQRQNRHASVQAALEEILSQVLNEPILIHGAGRTDRGVSARGQVISFETKQHPDLDALKYAVNRLLPGDISIVRFVEVDDGFDARHSCIGKRYSYAFTLGEKQPLLLGRVAYLGIREFDEHAFKDCLALFVGQHNFQNFTNKRIDKDGFIRDIEYICATCEDGIYHVELKSNGFMTYQIRFMIGAALKAGLKKITLEEVTAHLESSERAILPYKAPAEGLTLEEVYYGTDIFA